MTQHTSPPLGGQYAASAACGLLGVVTSDRLLAIVTMLMSITVGLPVVFKGGVYFAHAMADLIRAFWGIAPYYANEHVTDISSTALPPVPPAQSALPKPAECLAPNADGTPGCHGLGPDHSPMKEQQS